MQDRLQEKNPEFSHPQHDRVILEGKQVPLLIPIINLNLSVKAQVKAKGRREEEGEEG